MYSRNTMTSLVPWFGGSPYSGEVWDFDDVDFDLDIDIDYDGGRAPGRRRRRRGGGGGGGGGDKNTGPVMVHTNVDWIETENVHIFRADLPGVKKEQVKVQVEDGNILQISGEHTKEQEDENDKWHRMERRRGNFIRRFKLPKNSNLEDIRCSMENGVLTVTVGKKEADPKGKNVRPIDIE